MRLSAGRSDRIRLRRSITGAQEITVFVAEIPISADLYGINGKLVGILVVLALELNIEVKLVSLFDALLCDVVSLP